MSIGLARTVAAGRRPFSAHGGRTFLLAASLGLLGSLAASGSNAQGFFLFGTRPSYSVPVPEAPASHPRRKRPLPAVRARLMSPAEREKYADLLAAAKKGPLLAAISLRDQKVTLYADGVEIAHAPVSTGTASHPTPTGIFSIIQKNLFHRSNIYSNAPMPYMQRITWSGVALHQGVLPGYPASHGCIRLPDLFARQLWTITRLGVRVVVTRDPVAPVEFTHAALLKLPSQNVPQVDTAPTAPIKVAEGGATASDAKPAAAAQPAAQSATGTAGFEMDPRTLRPGPISVFVSRKEGRVFVRKGFVPLFDAPVTIVDPEKPIGTHLFTAMGLNGDGTLRWTAVSMPSYREAPTPLPARHKKRKRVHAPHNASAGPVELSASSVLSASEALDRVTIDPQTLGHITRLMSQGASYIISDQGLGRETGRETDFVVLTR